MLERARAGDSELDPEVIGQLRELARAGNPQLLHKLQASFARDTPERLGALRAAIAAGDADAVSFNLHTLKGSAANLGATKMVAICQELERFPAAPGRQEFEPLLAALDRHAASAEAALARVAEAG